MARGRMIAATVADDKRFNELPIDAALVYLMAIPQLDRDGLILGEPAVLWGTACRRRSDLLPRMVDIIAAWVSSGLVISYKTDDGDTILYFTGFQKNQAMTHYDREAESRFPCPPNYVRTPKGLVPEPVQQADQTPADELRTDSGPTPDKVLPKSIESKSNQSKAKEEEDDVIACWKENMPGTLTKTGAMPKVLSDDIGILVATHGRESVLSAILDAARNNARTIRYVTTILENRNGHHALSPPANGIVAGFSLDEMLGNGAPA